MYVSDLALNDFRSYSEVVLALEPGVNTFVGRNGQGKTNLVEAVGYLTTFSSHRAAADAALVRQGAEAAVVRARAVRDGRPTLIELEIVAGRANRARLNRAPVARTRDVLGIVRSVLFAPEDIELVRGEPATRRSFLDDLVVLLTPRLAGVRQEYDRVLRQRSALLKSAGSLGRRGRTAELSTLDVWDGQLALAGAELVAARVAALRALRPHVSRAYEQVSDDGGPARLAYRTALDAAEGTPDPGPLDDPEGLEARELALLAPGAAHDRLLAATQRLRTRELERGVSLVGPHRDDLLLFLGSLPVKGYASHGESWSFALALRLAAYAVLREQDGTGGPVLVLDDVFAELDLRRRERLAELVGDAEQVLVTAAVAEDVPPALTGVRFVVDAGTVCRA